MIKFTKKEKIKVDRFKKKVQEQYPGAYLAILPGGYYSVVIDNDDGIGYKDILSEFCIQPTTNPVKAWELAVLSSKSKQNFDRSHPLWIDSIADPKKLERILARQERIKTRKKYQK